MRAALTLLLCLAACSQQEALPEDQAQAETAMAKEAKSLEQAADEAVAIVENDAAGENLQAPNVESSERMQSR